MSDRPGPEFLDTNILVYAHDRSAGPKRTATQQLLRRLWESGDGRLSIQVLQEFYMAVTRKVERPLPIPEAAEIVRDLSFWGIHAPNAQDVLSASDLQRRFQLSFWDALVIHSAQSLGCAVLWSEDLADGQMYGTVQVKNPFK